MKPMQVSEKDVLQAVILNGLVPLAGERTPQALYYILKGRKANQTYQDVHLFRLHPYYRLIPALLKGSWDEILQNLLDYEYIELKRFPSHPHKQSFVITSAGQLWLARKREQLGLEHWLSGLNGVLYADQVQLYWWRLHLLVQTVSHLLHRNTLFSPVVEHRGVQRWVKQTLSDKTVRINWLDGLFFELVSILRDYPEELQRLLVDQLSGANQVGLTFSQLADQAGEPTLLLQIKMNHLLQEICMHLGTEEGKKHFPLLASVCMQEQPGDPRLSSSADKTYRLLRTGIGLEEIARRRRLKYNTVEDHLVEIALHCPEWDMSPYLTSEQQTAILTFSKQMQTKRLRVLKDGLGDIYTYLQLRLALARR